MSEVLNLEWHECTYCVHGWYDNMVNRCVPGKTCKALTASECAQFFNKQDIDMDVYNEMDTHDKVNVHSVFNKDVSYNDMIQELEESGVKRSIIKYIKALYTKAKARDKVSDIIHAGGDMEDIKDVVGE